MKGFTERIFRGGVSRWTWLLVLVTAATFWFLSHNHGYVPMWVEGVGEHSDSELIMFGYDQQRPSCWLHIGTRSLPLSLNPHIGPAWFYLYAPAAYLWFHRITNDPYVYRYTGILIFLISAWLFYYLIKKYYKPALAFYAATAFLTSPLLLLGSLTDYEFINAMVLVILLTALLFSHYIKTGSVAALLASAMSLGMTLETRTEALVWLVIPFAAYLLLVRPRVVLDRWQQTRRKLAVALGALGMFCLGAAPVIAYNIICPESNIFTFTANTIFKKSFDASSMPLGGRLLGRMGQFWNFNLLNIWSFYEMNVANYVMAALWVACASLVAVRWVWKRQPNLALLMVAIAVVLSFLTTSGLRNEHLMIIEPAALLVITSALAYLEGLTTWKKVAHIAFLALIVGNIAVAAWDWRKWHELPPTSQTLMNHSDPVLLANYLTEHHAGDRILYTNVGLAQYMNYMSVGRLKGEDITDWTGPAGFIQSVKRTLLDASRKRVFVAMSREHDGLAGAVPHTHVLYNTLDQYHVPYTVTPLANERNSALYDLIVVDGGVALDDNAPKTETLTAFDVIGARVVAQPTGERQVIGAVIGTGLKEGDACRINGSLFVPTFYGNDTWISFAIPLEALGDQNSFTLEVFRAQSMERSKPFTVTFQR